MNRRNALGAVAVALGTWEAVSFAGYCPPVSAAYAAMRGRWRRRADLALAVWLFWQAYHLTRYQKPCS